ncbi:unnamed protein product [Polarella glacialis]|nr:unnamed protein product [Polarella glacialis]
MPGVQLKVAVAASTVTPTLMPVTGLRHVPRKAAIAVGVTGGSSPMQVSYRQHALHSIEHALVQDAVAQDVSMVTSFRFTLLIGEVVEVVMALSHVLDRLPPASARSGRAWAQVSLGCFGRSCNQSQN